MAEIYFIFKEQVLWGFKKLVVRFVSFVVALSISSVSWSEQGIIHGYQCTTKWKGFTLSYGATIQSCIYESCSKYIAPYNPILEITITSIEGEYCHFYQANGDHVGGADGQAHAITVDCNTVVEGENAEIDLMCTLNESAAKNDGCTGKNGAGNPCNVATGNKFQSETDFTAGFSFTRSYNSQNLASIGMGKGWRHNYQRKLIVLDEKLIQVSGSGRGESWLKVNGAWEGDADSKINITETASGFELMKGNGVTENYNQDGQLVSRTDNSGHQTTYSYHANNTLAQVSNHYGQTIAFDYSNGNLSRVTDALNFAYRFEYDANNNLVKVICPDETQSDALDNPFRAYHYENTAFPNHLTGITDENGERYATWAYDSDGKAIVSEHANTTNGVGQEKVSLDYQPEQN